MKKKGIIILLVAIVVVLVIYFGIKGTLLYTYNKTIIADDTDLISLKESINQNKVQNITHVTSEDGYIYNVLDNSFTIFFAEEMELRSIGDDTDLFVNSEGKVILTVQEGSPLKNSFTEDFLKILDDENLSSDVEIISFLLNNYNKELNLFSSVNTLLNSACINVTLNMYSNSADSIETISGDYDGYILNVNDNILVVLINESDYYELTFYDATIDEVVDIISTVTF